MHPYDIDYATNKFWDALKARLQPLLGDVETTIGDGWMDAFEDCFSRHDFLALEVAKKTKGRGFDWFVIDIHEAGERLVGDEDTVIAGESREEAIAYILERCTECGVWPDQVAHLPEQDRIEFRLGDSLFAVIRRIPKDQDVSPDLKKRALTSIIGARKFPNCSVEILKRVNKWPGLSLVHEPPTRDLPLHMADTSEWLYSAKLLAAHAGQDDISTAQAQNIAAAAMGEQSWHHLCGHFQKPDDFPGSMAGPWRLGNQNEVEDGGSTVFASMLNGFVTLMQQARQLTADLPGCGLYVAGSMQGHQPYFVVTKPKSGTSDPKNMLHDFWTERVLLELTPLSHVPTNNELIGRVQTMTKDGFESGLRNLFQIKSTIEGRQEFQSDELKRQIIARDAGWIFSVDREDNQSGFRYVHASLVDTNGNTLCSASAGLHKAELNWRSDVLGYVLSSNYDGSHPVAIIKGISRNTAQLVASHFEEDSVGTSEFVEFDESDQRNFEHLIKQMREGGSAMY